MCVTWQRLQKVLYLTHELSGVDGIHSNHKYPRVRILGGGGGGGGKGKERGGGERGGRAREVKSKS